MIRTLTFIVVAMLLLGGSVHAASLGRFFLEGDGKVHLFNAKTHADGTITYRNVDGSYPAEAQRQIDRIFGVPIGSPEGIALRLIALLDYLQDHFHSGPIRIVSGYRSPQYNEGLRKKGKLAARTSMHIEGMAADIEIAGIDPRVLWDYVRSLDCCGAGYYHAKGIHVDVGPSRFWDETSTKVEQDIGGNNKLVLLRTDFDIYRPGDTARLSLGRITDYPVGIRPEAIVVKDGRELKKIAVSTSSDKCLLLQDRAAAHALVWKIPTEEGARDKVRIRLEFCEKPFPEMPDGTDSNPIVIE